MEILDDITICKIIEANKTFRFTPNASIINCEICDQLYYIFGEKLFHLYVIDRYRVGSDIINKHIMDNFHNYRLSTRLKEILIDGNIINDLDNILKQHQTYIRLRYS